MGAIVTTSEVLDQALRNAGLSEAFDERGIAHENCPGCGAVNGLKLSLARGRVQCRACGSEGPLLAYLREKSEAGDWNHAPYTEAEIIPIEPRLPREAEVPPPLSAELVEIVPQRAVEAAPEPVAMPAPGAAVSFAQPQRTKPKRRWGERVIITVLAVVFLLAGLAAAGLSGFANYQAFSVGVTDPSQARIWGWSGVIASVCSLGGFTFFWWHMTAKRVGEALRALAFALAGAGTSIAGTALFMANNADAQAVSWQSVEQVRALREAEIEDWSRQLAAIPPETRSIEGLQAYLAGVEAVGRTHQKPYRDAQNELGQARRRADLESKIAAARADLRQASERRARVRPAENLPAWFFALMLELFSSQGTSIALVSLLLLSSARNRTQAAFSTNTVPAE